MRSDWLGKWRGNGRFRSWRFDGSSRRRGRGYGYGWLWDFERRRKLYRNGWLDRLGLDRRRSRSDWLLRWSGRSRGGKTIFKFVDAGFEFVQILEAGFELVEGLNDAGKTLIVPLPVDAGLHPAIEGPHRKDDDPELHGTSGRVCWPCCGYRECTGR